MDQHLKPDEEGFYPAVETAEIVEGRITAVTINHSSIILTRINGIIHAFSASCPHASGDLTQGEMYRGRIGCPEHDYQFDIRTGYPVWPEDEVCRLKKYDTKSLAGILRVKI